MINTADILAKRKGFTRGLDEQFSGPVCGLHKYTDECGIEYLLVADDAEINIRKPFHIPVFEVSDAYPNDGFSGTTNSVDLSRWTDPSLGHRHLDSSLSLRSGVTSPLPMKWFKDATSRSYGVASKYDFPNTAATETVNFFIKANDTDGAGSLRLSLVNNGGTLTAEIFFIDAAGSAKSLVAGALTTVTTISGDLTVFSYNADTKKVKATIFIDGNGTPTELEAILTTVQDADLGQSSMVGLSASSDSSVGILEISSEPI